MSHVLCMNAKTFGQFARRINFYNTTPSFSILSFSVEIAHCDQKKHRTVSIPVRRNNSRNRPQSQKKTGSRFYLSRDPICMQICLNPDSCPFTRLYWRKFVLSLSRFSSVKSCRFKREGEREIYVLLRIFQYILIVEHWKLVIK